MNPGTSTYRQLLNAEQYVQVKKLRDNARHGIQPSVRGVRIGKR